MPTVLPQQNRQGTFISASLEVPSLPPEQQYIKLETTIAPNDLNSTKSLKLWIEVSPDNGQTWRHIAGTDWQGPSTTQPNIMVGPASAFLGQRVRGVLDIPDTVRVGAVAEFVAEI